MNPHARLRPPRANLITGISCVVRVAVHVDGKPDGTGDVDSFCGSLFRAQPTGEDGAVPGRPCPGDDARGYARRKDRVDTHVPAPGSLLEGGHGRDGRRPDGAGRLGKCPLHRLNWRKVQRVQHRNTQGGCEPDRRFVECVVVYHVIPGLPHLRVRSREARLGRGEGGRGADLGLL